MDRQCMQRSFLYVLKIYASMAHIFHVISFFFYLLVRSKNLMIMHVFQYRKNYNDVSYYSMDVLLTKHTHLHSFTFTF